MLSAYWKVGRSFKVEGIQTDGGVHIGFRDNLGHEDDDGDPEEDRPLQKMVLEQLIGFLGGIA